MAEEPVLKDLRNLKSNEAHIKWEALNNISKYLSELKPDDVRYRMIIKYYLAMVKDPDEKIREKVLSTLLRVLDDQKQLGVLVTQGLSDANPGIRSLALEWLRDHDHPALRNNTVKALSDPSDVVRKTAIEIAIAKKFEGIESQLLSMLKSESGGLRRQVIYALGKLKTSQAIGTLIDIMRNPDYDDWTRNQASSALEHMGGEGIIEPFLNNLVDSNPYIRETAAAYLSKNKDALIPFILQTGRLDLVGLLQYGSEHTKEDFSQIVSALSNQMEFAFQDLKTRIISKDQIEFSKLADEFQFSEIALKTLIEKVLKLDLIEISSNKFLTETGLLKLLTEEVSTKSSLYIPNLLRNRPFKDLPQVTLQKIIGKIPNLLQLTKNLFIDQIYYSDLQESFSSTGILNIQDIVQKLGLKKEIIEEELIPKIYSKEERWTNSNNDLITPEYLDTKIKTILHDKGILSIKNLLNELSHPKIADQYLVERISSHHRGTWLSDLKVFIPEKEFISIQENSARLDESRVSHLLQHIDIKFSEFLSSLQKVLNIQTYQTKSGTVVTLESLHPYLQQEILGRGYLNVVKFIESKSLQKQKDEAKAAIIQFISQEFSGRLNPSNNYFFTEELINKISKEIETKSRLNFEILAYKTELPQEIIVTIIREILFIRGFKNRIGEFITERTIQLELNGILEHKQEFSLPEFFELLDISKEREKEELVQEILSEDSRLFITKDKMKFITKKRAINNLFRYLKDPTQQTRNLIPWSELSNKLNLTEKELKTMLDSLVQNQFLAGSINKNGYVP